MNTVVRITRYQVRDIIRSRWLSGYAVVLLALTEALYRLGGDGGRALLSLMNVILFLVPLVALLFGTLYLYHAREFIELALAQPVGRRTMFAGLYAGLAFPMAAALVVGVGGPLLWRAGPGVIPWPWLLTLLGTGVLLTLAFTAIAFVIALRFDDRARGFGAALAVWLAAGVLYDGLVLLLTIAFSAYPLERPLLALTMANPLDLGRVALMLEFDRAALMGYTGAVFRKVLGGETGFIFATAGLALWIALPLGLGLRRFRTRDF